MGSSLVLRRQPLVHRGVGWLAVLLMLAAALLGPSAAHVRAASVTPEYISVTSNIPCGNHDDTHAGGQTWLEFKVDPIVAGTHAVPDYGSITISNVVDDKTFDWSANFGVDAVYVKAGEAGSHLYVYAGNESASEQTGDTALTSPGEGVTNEINHVAFCFDAATPASSSAPSSAPSSEPSGGVGDASAAPSAAPSSAPSTAPSAAPSDDVDASTNPSEDPSGGEVVDSTDGPGGAAATPPPTDAVAPTGRSTEGWRMALIAMAALMAGALVLAPVRSSRPR